MKAIHRYASHALNLGDSALPDAQEVGNRIATRTLFASGVFWLTITLLGQWAFFYYIMAFYGGSVVEADFTVWNRLAAVGSSPYKPGDTSGNLVFAAHALGAGIVAFGGALQLLPKLRLRAPRFHRWNGRIYLLTVVTLAFSGFYLTWVRDTNATPLSAIGSSINGASIFVFAYFALVRARARDIYHHQQWALRLYLVSNAQWFLRIGLFSYLIIARAAGMEVNPEGNFFRFWTFGCYLVPLAVLQLFLVAKPSNRPALKVATALVLTTVTVLTGVGVVGYAVFTQLLMTGAPIAL